MNRHFSTPLTWLVAISCTFESLAASAAEPSREDVLAAMKRAAKFYWDKIAVNGGYVYYHSLDGKQRLGEGVASPTQIWVQPPGTPTVGLAYLAAYEATGDAWYLEAADAAAEALIYGQLTSGGWTHSIDFDPNGRTAAYRNGKGKGKDNSTLDDGSTQTALLFLMRADQAHNFTHKEIHEAAQIALDALLAAQFPNGGFPQVWNGPAESRPVVAAKYPDYDWRTENRIKEYWTQYTLNDDLAGDVADTLIAAAEIYRDERAEVALRKLGDFLILAQMPDPQPAWAQQYDAEMRPIWARKFEPPAITGRESQDAIAALLKIHRATGDAKYLEPIPAAIAYLRMSLLPDGQLARYYELQTNRPLYMTKDYELTYSHDDVPTHYGWTARSNLDPLETEYLKAKRGNSAKSSAGEAPSAGKIAAILKSLDDKGRWATEYDNRPLAGQPKFRPGDRYLSSAVFSSNLTLLSRYAAAR